MPAGRRPPPSSSRSWFYEWAWRRAPSSLFTPLFVTSRSRDWERAPGTPFTRRVGGGRRGPLGGRSRDGAGSRQGGREARGPEWKEAGPHKVVLNLPPPGREQRSVNKSLSGGGNSGWGREPSSGFLFVGNGSGSVTPVPSGAAQPAKYKEATSEGNPWPFAVNTAPSTADCPSHRARYCLAPEAARTAM